MRVKMHGVGIVASQNLPAGHIIRKGEKITVHLAMKGTDIDEPKSVDDTAESDEEVEPSESGETTSTAGDNKPDVAAATEPLQETENDKRKYNRQKEQPQNKKSDKPMPEAVDKKSGKTSAKLEQSSVKTDKFVTKKEKSSPKTKKYSSNVDKGSLKAKESVTEKDKSLSKSKDSDKNSKSNEGKSFNYQKKK